MIKSVVFAMLILSLVSCASRNSMVSPSISLEGNNHSSICFEVIQDWLLPYLVEFDADKICAEWR